MEIVEYYYVKLDLINKQLKHFHFFSLYITISMVKIYYATHEKKF